MDLACRHCSCRWPHDAVIEAMQLHFNVEHDTNEIHLDLIAVCRCGATMRHTGSGQLGGGRTRERYHCDACGGDGSIDRNPS